jgi:ER lumen protein retaining receptor
MYRYVGDGLHLLGVIVLLITLAKNKGCTGISRGTQVLRLSVFVTRYLDLLDHNQIEYLVFFKLTYIITSIIVLLVFWKCDSTYERQKDTCSLLVIFLPCTTAATLLANEHTVLEICWTFSQFLAGFAMVPQYIFCYRDRGAKDWGVSFYVLALGGYRVFYALNWIYKKVMMPQYYDIHSWIGGALEIIFFVDFIIFRFTTKSMLRTAALKVDEKVNEIQYKVESKVLGSSRSVSLAEESAGELRRRRAAPKEENVELSENLDLEGGPSKADPNLDNFFQD